MITVIDEFLHDQLQVGEPTVGLNSKSFKVCGFQLALPIKFRKGEGYSFQPQPQASPHVAMVIFFIVSSDVCCLFYIHHFSFTCKEKYIVGPVYKLLL